jgi:hypothetical protein
MPRYEEICAQFGLGSRDRELLETVLGYLKPDYTLEDVIEVVERFKEQPNIERVWAAIELMTREAAEASSRRRFDEDREQN